jgi:hypothetical protein
MWVQAIRLSQAGPGGAQSEKGGSDEDCVHMGVEHSINPSAAARDHELPSSQDREGLYERCMLGCTTGRPDAACAVHCLALMSVPYFVQGLCDWGCIEEATISQLALYWAGPAHKLSWMHCRLHVSVPEALTDMDVQWPDGSSQKSARPIRPQPMKAELAAPSPPGTSVEGSLFAADGSSMGFRPVTSVACVAPFRQSQALASASSLMPVSGLCAPHGPWHPPCAALAG